MRVLVVGAAGFLAGRVLPEFRRRYDLTLLDVRTTNREGEAIEGVQVADLIDPDRDAYRHHFRCVDVVVHCGAARPARPEDAPSPPDNGFRDIRFQGRVKVRTDFDFEQQMANVRMAYNIYQTSVEEGVRRVVMLSSNHAADFYEHLIWKGEMSTVTPEMIPLSDNYYGWAKGAYESLGFLFAAGEWTDQPSLEVIQLRIGGPREDDAEHFTPDEPEMMHRQLGCYLSARDQVQLMTKCVEVADIRNDDGVPFQVFYGISDNTHKFWDLSNARRVIGYAPEDDSAIKFVDRVGAVMAEAKRIRYPGGESV